MNQVDKLVPLIHKAFKNETDATYIDVEDININLLAETRNLTPFRRMGSLKQIGGTSFAQINGTSLSYANLPQVTNYLPVDFYTFTVDRDNTEVTILIYEHDSTGEIKIFINPYFNPDTTFSNNNPTKTANSWIYEWLELTEYYSTAINGTPVTSTFITDSNFGKGDDYFNGWFVVNTSLANSLVNKYNLITNFESGTNTFTAEALPTGWSDNDNVSFYRFPCVYFYNAIVPNPDSPDYTGVATTFKGKPTQFIEEQNELRMPCGKALRPLILTMLYKKKYFQDGDNEITYDGFWFDFQQVPQVLYNSAISCLPESITYAGDECWLYNAGSDGASLQGSAPANAVKFAYTIGELPITIACTRQEFPEYGPAPGGWYLFHNNSLGLRVTGIGVSPVLEIGFQVHTSSAYTPTVITIQHILDAYYGLTGYGFVFGLAATLVGTASTVISAPSGTTAWQRVYVLYPSGATLNGIAEADGNRLATNLFLGSYMASVELADPIVTGKYITPFILTLLIDNRNEIILSQGRIHSNPSSASSYAEASRIYFNCWFNRRLTHMRIYTGTTQDTTSNLSVTPLVYPDDNYPYFKWAKEVNINELPNLSTYSLESVTAPINGQMPYQQVPVNNSATGLNCWAWEDRYWYLIFEHNYIKFATRGQNFKFIVNTNRYIDQDITMNYTRGVKVGQTNGRFFIINCKNEIEKEVFENDDMVLYNTLAVGVSAYDIFTRDKVLNIALGDKDTNRAIVNFNGYLMNIKDTNVYGIDINTDDELRYRVIQTQIGRGAINPDSICTTPHGIVMPAEDSVYLLTNKGVRPLLRADNGRLNFYKTYFFDKTTYYSNIISAYYNDFDELILLQKPPDRSSELYIMCYNFQYDAWTTYQYNLGTLTAPAHYVKMRTNSSRQVLFLNVKDSTHYNIVKFDETSSVYKNTSGSDEQVRFGMKTHKLAYGNKLLDSLLNWLVINYDSTAGSDLKLKVTITRNPYKYTTPAIETVYLDIKSGTAINRVFNQLISIASATDQFDILIENITNAGATQAFTNFVINSFTIWLSNQPRQLVQTTLT